jgi:uracil-DNA glycosylase
MALRELNEQIRKCRRCRLWQGARNAVPGEGSLNARVMLVGQNPGAEEDKTGRPFVGRAGKYLDKVLTSSGLSRDNMFVTNVVKHISPENRKPLPVEIAACTPYLLEQIKKIKPKIIVLMGTVAWQVTRVAGIGYVETCHPSAAMRFTKMKKKFETDFNLLSETLHSYL